MTDEMRKFLTEEVLGECWHEQDGDGHKTIGAMCTCGLVSFNAKHAEKNNRTFATHADMMDLYGAIWKDDEEWIRFYSMIYGNFITARRYYGLSTPRFEAWLFNLSADPAEYEARCRMVVEFRKGV